MTGAIHRGHAHVYGDDINTDYILPAVWMAVSDPAVMGEHTFELHDPDFLGRVQEDDFVVGGTNFGCGSSREHAPLALKASGVRVVVAKTFARIFYRNCINIGLPVITLGHDSDMAFSTGDEIVADLAAGTIENVTTGVSAAIQPMPDFMLKIFDAGGLLPAFQSGVLA